MTYLRPVRQDWLSQVTIRHLEAGDLPALEWDGEYTHFRRLFQDAYEYALQGRSILWVADLQGRGVIGQLFIQLFSGRRELADGNNRAYIYGFRIQPPYRRAGLGTRMMNVAEQELIARDFQYVTLNVGHNNPDAKRLYETHGYQVVASEPGRWSYLDHEGIRRDVDEPAWRMEKKLSPRVS
ncbi:MAG TPA: GNAT family N-acetyltransferase [Anaerolineales bacterium]|nr:GNAT family N-acetyltransferase [Anaerolineales bacterium]